MIPRPPNSPPFPTPTLSRPLHAVTAPALALVLLLAVSITPVAGAGEPTREEALRALAGAADAEARRQAARALGERGAMEDIPRLARALRDADPLVPTVAESALWQGWGRPGRAEGG